MKYQLLFLFAICFATAVKAQQHPDFSGTWARNTEKCEVSQGLSINSVPTDLTIKQSNSILDISSTSKNRAGEVSNSNEKPAFDGTPFLTVTKSKFNKKALIKWGQNPNELSLTEELTNDQGSVTQKFSETWSLQDDGKTLVIKATIDANNTQYTATEVFDKK